MRAMRGSDPEGVDSSRVDSPRVDSPRWRSSTGPRRLADRLLASDPGLKRLRDASRVTLALVSSSLASYLLVVVAGGGFAIAPLFGGIVALLAAMSVRDESLGGRKATTLLLFLPAAASVSLAGLLSSASWAHGLALSAIIFSTFYIRRFGPRYVAAGLVASITFFVTSIISSMLGLGPGQLPWILASMAVGVVCTYLIRFYLLPDNPRSVLRRGLAAFDIQLGITLETITGTLAERRAVKDREKRLGRESARLHERVSAVEGHLLAGEAEVSRERSDRLRLYLFDAEMSANTLSEIVWNDANSECAFPSEVREPLLRSLRELCDALRQGSVPAQVPQALRDLERAREKAATSESDAGWSFQARRAEAAIRQLSQGTGEEEELVPTSSESSQEEDPERDRLSSRGGIAGRLRPTTVQGIQATLAVGLALAAGEVFSPSRPYWVVIVAFIVFAGSGTLGDTLARGFQRTVGTLVGAVAGFLLARAVSGSLSLEAPLIVACVFLAFYMFSISQTLMMFWITVVLALAFDVIGLLNDGGILALRFFDTLLGSAIGFAVSALVLPTRPSDEFRQCASDFLDSLEDYVRDRVRRLAGGEAGRHPVEQAREVEEKLQAVIQNADTARRQAMVFGRSRTELDRWMTGLLALNYYARHLSGPVGRSQRLREDNDQSVLLREIGDRISSNIGSLRRALSEDEEPRIQDIEGQMQRLESGLTESAPEDGPKTPANAREASPAPTLSPVPGQAGPANSLHYLRRINRTLGELAATPAIGKRRKRKAASRTPGT